MPFHKLAFKGSGGTQTTHFPFEISGHRDSNGNFYVTVRFGTISGLIPDNISDFLYLNDTGTFYIKLGCQTNGKIPTFITLYSDNQPEDNSATVTQGSPPPDFNITLGVVKAKKVYQVVYDNMIATPKVVFLETKTQGLSAGQEPFNRWWAWQVE